MIMKKREATNPEPEATPTGKGRPTPSRKQAEAANARPLVGGQNKQARQQVKQARTDARERARIGMMNGEERYLTARDKGPQRRFVRDYVDARWSIGEWLIPATLLFLVLSFFPGPTQNLTLILIWGFVLIAVIDAFILGAIVHRRIQAKFGADNVEKGLRFYAGMRSFQFRMLRVPKPQVKRGQYPS